MATQRGHELCLVEGKVIIPTKDAAKAEARAIRVRSKGRGGYYRCAFGEHYHVTKGLKRKSRGGF
jgi:hypothetical protein